jgi:N-glycosylase/DNA lyase
MTAVFYATQNAFGAAAADALYFCRQAVLGLATAARARAVDAVAGCASLVEQRRARTAPPRVVPREPAIIGIEGQWVRATGIIRSALASFGNIETFQAAAARQIDAADYALQLLIQDLSAAMPIPIPIPADGRALRAVLAEAAKSPTPAARPKKALAA